ncbi:posphoenolpyruvate synthetase regulatory kinase/phosphorylase PpsR [Legionella spiritensis]|uniref:Putative phosphoenolpyruvate synthase regulatory protein n=1 Tax=Legionella spiritensis TaxID=452 RepID=A0A0W0YY22_LEGSP|nr:pyruvate, water dikinase regulatory protein [Legionella spiritensis]KTD61802.1 putative phosphotransferase [Legionella spiritensis]SNV38143.1 Putative phosphotransferase [Legionella spiritensis]VEG90186.1 Putative phosphotransferase [Legionella spiritensis]
MKQYVFMISDGTGITAENLGNTLLTQFGAIDFEKLTIPYIDNLEKAEAAIRRINDSFTETGLKPLVFMTLINTEIAKKISLSNANVFDLFNTFLGPLEKALNIKSSYTVGRAHGVSNSQSYSHRIEAVDYALAHDDGIKIRGYDKADIILIGVSRCGKTPSCLYMALHFGILAANYPFTEEDLSSYRLPDILRPYKSKLFGLTIDTERLQQIRTERRPDSKYSSMEQCRLEVSEVEAMYKRENIPFLNTTRYSIEEIATKILAIANIKRKF